MWDEGKIHTVGKSLDWIIAIPSTILHYEKLNGLMVFNVYRLLFIIISRFMA